MKPSSTLLAIDVGSQSPSSVKLSPEDLHKAMELLVRVSMVLNLRGIPFRFVPGGGPHGAPCGMTLIEFDGGARLLSVIPDLAVGMMFLELKVEPLKGCSLRQEDLDIFNEAHGDRQRLLHAAVRNGDLEVRCALSIKSEITVELIVDALYDLMALCKSLVDMRARAAVSP